MKKQLVLGIMSGTSIDGVDYALCDIDAKQVKLRALWSVAFPRELERRLHEAARGEMPSHALGQLHHDLGRFYARHALKGAGHQRPQLVGLHGQTVFHNPDRKQPATLQLGEPAYLAEELRVPVTSNFRSADMAAGGEGAPLATIFHFRVFGKAGKHVCVNNLGGISNVTSIDWRKGRGGQAVVKAFDTGPANILMDHAMRHLTKGKQRFDADGSWAARGRVSERLLAAWLTHPYLTQRPPKSTGRELFGEPYLRALLRQVKKCGLSKYDLLATLTEFTARSLALNYRLHLASAPGEVILTGGGAANRALVAAIQRNLCGTDATPKVLTCEATGWPVNSIEPAAFALLAWLRIHLLPGNLPQTTGANRPVVCGQISTP